MDGWAGPAAWVGLPANIRGMAWAVVTALLFVLITVIVRHLSSAMDPLQVAFLRYVFGLAVLAPFFIGRGRSRQFRTRHLRLHGIRGLMHAVGVCLWFYAMSRISIAEVTALGFTAPVFAALGAILFLGERADAHRLGAVAIGFLGAMVVLRPGLVAIEWGSAAMMVAAPLFAASKLIIKPLSARETGITIVFYQTVFVSLFTAAPAALVWQTPVWSELGWIALMAILATVGHLTMVRAYRAAEIGAVQPIEFIQLPFATLLGFIVFAEFPAFAVLAGGVIIFAGATYIARREARLARQ